LIFDLEFGRFLWCIALTDQQTYVVTHRREKTAYHTGQVLSQDL
jgi:hypothetical protein